MQISVGEFSSQIIVVKFRHKSRFNSGSPLRILKRRSPDSKHRPSLSFEREGKGRKGMATKGRERKGDFPFLPFRFFLLSSFFFLSAFFLLLSSFFFLLSSFFFFFLLRPPFPFQKGKEMKGNGMEGNGRGLPFPFLLSSCLCLLFPFLFFLSFPSQKRRKEKKEMKGGVNFRDR